MNNERNIYFVQWCDDLVSYCIAFLKICIFHNLYVKYHYDSEKIMFIKLTYHSANESGQSTNKNLFFAY